MIKLILITLMCYSPLICGEWTQLSSLETSLTSPKIESIDENNIMVSGNVGAIIPYVFKSIDRGTTWNISLEDSVITDDSGKVIYHPRRVNDFKYMTKNNAFVMCEGTIYWFTTDGGENWFQDSLIEGSNSLFRYINFNSLSHGVTTLGYNLYLTKNYGKTFETIKIKSETDTLINKSVFDNFKITDQNLIFGLGYYIVSPYHKDNKIFTILSKDLGKSWEVSSFLEKSIIDYNFLPNGNIIAVGAEQTKPYKSTYRDIIQISTDGGYTWEEIMDSVSVPSAALWNLDFINDMEGIAFSEGFSKLIRTSDGGRTWYRDYGISELPHAPEDYTYLPNGEILAVARTGKVYKWTDPTLSVEEDKGYIDKPNIRIYPNPISENEVINIEITPTFSGQMELSLIDITGRKLSTNQLEIATTKKQTLNYKPDNDLPSGVYFFQVEYRNGIAERQKFIVE